jgi:hypothetical protein
MKGTCLELKLGEFRLRGTCSIMGFESDFSCIEILCGCDILVGVCLVGLGGRLSFGWGRCGFGFSFLVRFFLWFRSILKLADHSVKD